MSLADERAGLGHNPDQQLPSPWKAGARHMSHVGQDGFRQPAHATSSNRRPSDYESKSLRPAGAALTRSGCSRQRARPAQCVPDLPRYGRRNDRQNDRPTRQGPRGCGLPSCVVPVLREAGTGDLALFVTEQRCEALLQHDRFHGEVEPAAFPERGKTLGHTGSVQEVPGRREPAASDTILYEVCGLVGRFTLGALVHVHHRRVECPFQVLVVSRLGGAGNLVPGLA
jgi:hypothetical protein